MSNRLYSESEVAAIIAQAAERQRDAPPAADGPGLTLAEIEAVGREAGLDPSLLRHAAADLDAGRLGTAPRGTAITERWIEAPIPPGAWEDAVADLRATLATPAFMAGGSDVTAIGADQQWSHSTGTGTTTTVTLSPRGERTRLRVVQSDGGGSARTMGMVVAGVLSLLAGMLGGAIVAETLAMGDLAGIAVVVLVLLAGTAAGGPAVARAVTRRRERQAVDAERLADDLARRLVTPADTLRQSGEEVFVGPRLDLDDISVEPKSPASRRRTQA